MLLAPAPYVKHAPVAAEWTLLSPLPCKIFTLVLLVFLFVVFYIAFMYRSMCIWQCGNLYRYMTLTEWTPAKIDLFKKALFDAMSVPLQDIAIVSVTESTTTRLASKTISVVKIFSFWIKVRTLMHTSLQWFPLNSLSLLGVCRSQKCLLEKALRVWLPRRPLSHTRRSRRNSSPTPLPPRSRPWPWLGKVVLVPLAPRLPQHYWQTPSVSARTSLTRVLCLACHRLIHPYHAISPEQVLTNTAMDIFLNCLSLGCWCLRIPIESLSDN